MECNYGMTIYDDVMLRVISYNFSDASIVSYYSVLSRGLTTITIEVGLACWRRIS